MTTVTPSMIAAHGVLHGMSPEHLQALVSAAHYAEFPQGHRFFTEDGVADRFWLVHAGEVAIDHRRCGGPLVVETLGRGSVVGWSWLFPPYEWRFGAVARQPVRAVEFDGRRVRALAAADPELDRELTHRFAAVMLERLQAARLRLIEPGEQRRETV